MPNITADEKRWRARDDAYTLSSAEVIKNDPERLRAAQAEAQAMADEKREEQKAMEKVAKTGGNTRPSAAAGTGPPQGKFRQDSGGGAAAPSRFNVFQDITKR